MNPNTDTTDTRGAITLVDVILGVAVLLATLALAPILYQFIGMASAEADPLTALVLQLAVPVLILGVVISMGVSAGRPS